MTNWEEVRVRIQRRREALGLSQAQLGKALGLSGNNVAQVEGGLPISERKLDGFAQALGVSVAFLRYGIVTELDRAAIEADAFQAGRDDVLVGLRGWLERMEQPLPGASAGGTFTREEFTAVTPARRAELERQRDAARAETAATTDAPKRKGRGR